MVELCLTNADHVLGHAYRGPLEKILTAAAAALRNLVHRRSLGVVWLQAMTLTPSQLNTSLSFDARFDTFMYFTDNKPSGSASLSEGTGQWEFTTGAFLLFDTAFRVDPDGWMWKVRSRVASTNQLYDGAALLLEAIDDEPVDERPVFEESAYDRTNLRETRFR